MYIDTHCHLNFHAFTHDYKDVYQDAQNHDVEYIIIVGTKLSSSKRAIEMAHELPGCFAAVGIHPHHLREFETVGKEVAKKELQSLLKEKNVVAVGETGIDYHVYKDYPPINEENKQKQRELLQIHLELAEEHNLPLILHCREAMDDMISYFNQWTFLSHPRPRGVFHCFSGNKDQLNRVLSMGFYVGFDGNIGYKGNGELQSVVADTPLNRLLLETDAPFLTPVPHRGERNIPSYIPLIAQTVASLHNMSIDSLMEAATYNAKKLFQLPSKTE